VYRITAFKKLIFILVLQLCLAAMVALLSSVSSYIAVQREARTAAYTRELAKWRSSPEHPAPVKILNLDYGEFAQVAEDTSRRYASSASTCVVVSLFVVAFPFWSCGF
jgi:hypothetical protein